MITVEKEVYEAVLRNSLRVNDLEEENAKLKELLKECREVVVNSDVEYEKRAKLALKLHEVLKWKYLI